MQIGVIGLGRMSDNISRRLVRAGHGCAVYDANPTPARRLLRKALKPLVHWRIW
jgi:6-phosphogluconate dehydrogenase